MPNHVKTILLILVLFAILSCTSSNTLTKNQAVFFDNLSGRNRILASGIIGEESSFVSVCMPGNKYGIALSNYNFSTNSISKPVFIYDVEKIPVAASCETSEIFVVLFSSEKEIKKYSLLVLNESGEKVNETNLLQSKEIVNFDFSNINNEKLLSCYDTDKITVFSLEHNSGTFKKCELNSGADLIKSDRNRLLTYKIENKEIIVNRLDLNNSALELSYNIKCDFDIEHVNDAIYKDDSTIFIYSTYDESKKSMNYGLLAHSNEKKDVLKSKNILYPFIEDKNRILSLQSFDNEIKLSEISASNTFEDIESFNMENRVYNLMFHKFNENTCISGFSKNKGKFSGFIIPCSVN